MEQQTGRGSGRGTFAVRSLGNAIKRVYLRTEIRENTVVASDLGAKPEVAGYIRVSSAAQRDQSDSPASQRERLRQAGCTAFYEDLAVSGFKREARQKAHGYNRLLADIAAGRITRLVCTRLDRAGRRDDLVLALVDACEAAGIEFVALASGGTVSTTTAASWLGVKTQLMLGEFYSRQLSESIRSGYQGLHAQGIPARSAASLPVHLQRTAGTRHGVEPSPAWPACREAIEQFIAGRWTLADCGRYLHEQIGRLSTGKAVAMWLRGQHLLGHMAKRDGTVLIEDCWPAIASAEEFAQIQLRLSTRRRVWGVNVNREVRALSGLCRCYHCGRGLAHDSARRPSGVYRYVRCTYQSCPSKRAGIRADLLEQALFLQWVADHLGLIAEAQATASNVQIPSAALLTLRQELQAREALPPQFRTEQDRQRIGELQQQIRRESAAPPDLDPAIVALLGDQLRTVPIDSGWPAPMFHGQIDGPPGSSWGWFEGRPDPQRNQELSLLIERHGVLVDTTIRDRHKWIRAVSWRLVVTDGRGSPLGVTGEQPQELQEAG
ncbi:MAG: recombinase family protein [Synechococcaceae cyanobacterium]|nr:recombinase family protein [Synechococcaceae cyanobacterium]